MDSSTLSVYAKRLSKEHFEDVITALEKIAEMPRHEGELAFPEVGAVLAMVEVVRIARHNREMVAHNQRLVVWKCPACKCQQTGFLEKGVDAFRTCQRPVGQDSRGGIVRCGRLLTVILDERAA